MTSIIEKQRQKDGVFFFPNPHCISRINSPATGAIFCPTIRKSLDYIIEAMISISWLDVKRVLAVRLLL